MEDAAWREAGNQPMPPSRANKEQPRNQLGQQPQPLQNSPEQQPPQPSPSAEPKEWPHKFQLGPDWVMVTKRDAGPRETLPYHILAEYDAIDKELGREKVQDVLEDYLDKTTTVGQVLISENPGITGSEVTKVMEVDTQEAEPAAKVLDQLTETEQLELSPQDFLPGIDRTRVHPVFDQQSQLAPISSYSCRECPFGHPSLGSSRPGPVQSPGCWETRLVTH